MAVTAGRVARGRTGGRGPRPGSWGTIARRAASEPTPVAATAATTRISPTRCRSAHGRTRRAHAPGTSGIAARCCSTSASASRSSPRCSCSSSPSRVSLVQRPPVGGGQRQRPVDLEGRVPQAARDQRVPHRLPEPPDPDAAHRRPPADRRRQARQSILDAAQPAGRHDLARAAGRRQRDGAARPVAERDGDRRGRSTRASPTTRPRPSCATLDDRRRARARRRARRRPPTRRRPPPRPRPTRRSRTSRPARTGRPSPRPPRPMRPRTRAGTSASSTRTRRSTRPSSTP